ncbi:MAG: aminotransferase class I/II-fold pyridoxal phosphate-dependent enzyme, partial [Clostridia bacterium]|nr:aminotransferase class I/II-fold pyridoxal phosphate-dependent enzyme [Clostridia bacterium]
DGPDMDKIEELVKNSNVKGIICVPKYTNPEGITFSDEVVRRFASLKPAAEDFRVIWDNAYIVHDFNDTPDSLLNIFDVAKEYGNEDLFIEVTSTSKITFPGAGVSALAASDKNIDLIKKRMTIQVIGHDKINQLRHARYLKDLNTVKEHMKKHAEIIRPKFETVLHAFSKELDGLGIARWTTPNGGYFISLYVMAGTAKKVGELCKEAGVTLTKVGATYPYGIDPDDSNIRIAPTFPDVDELEAAVEILCLCIKLAAVEKLLETAE